MSQSLVEGEMHMMATSVCAYPQSLQYSSVLGSVSLSIYCLIVQVSSTDPHIGAAFPVYARRHQGLGVPEWAFFVAKFFGSGVIIATSFIHVSGISTHKCAIHTLTPPQLMAPASDALTSPCLGGIYAKYDWAEGIALMTIFVLFPIELLTMRYAKFAEDAAEKDEHPVEQSSSEVSQESVLMKASPSPTSSEITMEAAPRTSSSHMPGQDHFGHARNHVDNEDVEETWRTRASVGALIPESYAAQLTAIFILEFGVIFHSIFIGLTLAVAAWDDFKILYIVLVFHQTFEGLGLGSRLASVPWPKSKRWTPYLLASAFGLTTPIAIAIGLGVRTSYPPTSNRSLVVNGVFDAISAGILIYTGLVELMAHEFLFNNHMRTAPIREVAAAFGLMCLGAGLMALLGRWA